MLRRAIKNLRPAPTRFSRTAAALAALALLATLAAPAAAQAPELTRAQAKAVGVISQPGGERGCVVDRSSKKAGCATARALEGPAPFLGSNALAISPNGKNLYVASRRSNAIAIFERRPGSGKLTQAEGEEGCIAEAGAHGCASALGLIGANSVAVSPNGKNVYATAVGSSAVTTFVRDRKSGALTQPPAGRGCISDDDVPGCTTGRALTGADVVVASPDGKNVYVGAFFGNAVAVFDRAPATGFLTQPADATGCLTDAPTDGCTTALALGAPEGMAISGDGKNVYVATALSNAVLNLVRDPSTGALSQASDGSGCIVNAELAGCTTGIWIEGANAVAVTPDDTDVYVTSLISNSVTSFSRDLSTGTLTQKSGTAACSIFVLAVGCSLSRALEAPEGIATSPDDANAYAAAFNSNAVDSYNRDPSTGGLIQKANRAGCATTSNAPDCRRARALKKVGGLTVSPDGRHVYAGAFQSNAIAVFKRVTLRP